MRTVAWLVLVAACGPDNDGTHRKPDAYEYIPDAPCRANSVSYAAKLADGTTPLVGASVVVHGDPSRSTSTDVDGQFVLCAPQGTFSVDVDGSALDGTIIEWNSYEDGYLVFPAFTAARLADILAASGQTADPTKATVIGVTPGSDALALTAAHGTSLGESTAWAPSGQDHILLFPNVDPGATTLSRLADGTTVPLTATPGRITWVHYPHIEI